MLTGDAYSSGHLVPSHLGLAYVLLVETNPFPELVFFQTSLRTSLGTFSISLEDENGKSIEMEVLTLKKACCVEEFTPKGFVERAYEYNIQFI